MTLRPATTSSFASMTTLARLALILLALAPSAAAAQGADIRDVRPAVMLLLDTSGSMERRPDCECNNPNGNCAECYPVCAQKQRSKWHMALEALTGSWGDNFTCARQQRPVGAYDAGYPMPHFNHPAASVEQADGVIDSYAEDVLFGLMTFDSEPTWLGAPDVVSVSQFNTTKSTSGPGHFSYAGPRTYGFPGCGEPHELDLGARAGGTVGPLISTGRGEVQVNTDVQNALLGYAAYDQLRPYGPTPVAAMVEDYSFYLGNHPDMQEGGDPMLGCRPRYAILITDGYPNADMRGAPYFCEVESADNSLSDGVTGCPYERTEVTVASLCAASNGACRGDVDGVFVVGFDVNDASTKAWMDDLADVGGTEHAYFASSAAELAERLTEVLNSIKLTAPGLDVSSRNPPVMTNGAGGYHAQFNSGYRQHGEDEPWEGILERKRFLCEAGEPTEQPVDDVDRFHEVISAQSDRALYTVVPSNRCHVRAHLTGQVSALGGLNYSPSNGAGDGGANDACSGDAVSGSPTCPVPTKDDVEDPFSDSTCALDPDRTTPYQENLALEAFTLANTDISESHLFLSGTAAGMKAQRKAIIEWVRGDTRQNDLGAIMHSRPVLVGPPERIADETHTLFREQKAVAERPSVLYFGTSDGILHAVSAVAQKGGTGASAYDLDAGEELWGFIPPALLPNLQAAMSRPQPMLDGTPVVREVFATRSHDAAPSADAYRTILITGFRAGGPGYIGLDVTDPTQPKFLWQFSHPSMGRSYGTPAITQVAVTIDDRVEERALAILPGGDGEDISAQLGCGKCYVCGGVPQLDAPPASQVDSGACALNTPRGCESKGIGQPAANLGSIEARERRRCWDTQGRNLFFIDPITGQLVARLDDSVFGAPLVGGVSVFPGETGTVASAAYTTDADGIIWRVDLSNPDPAQWSAAPLFDMFAGEGPADAQPAYEAPVITTDELGNVVILQATGNVDAYDAYTINKVVSLRESFSIEAITSGDTQETQYRIDGSTTGAELNWLITLRPSEQVTGPLTLFDGKVYFSTFTGMPKAANAGVCAFGESRIWGVHYTESVDPADAPAEELDATGLCMPRTPANQREGVRWPRGALAGSAGADAAGRCFGAYENLMILGTEVAQRPSCFPISDEDYYDAYLGNVSHSQAGAHAGGAFEIVALTNGGTPVAGAELSEIRQSITPPAQFTRATGSYAADAD